METLEGSKKKRGKAADITPKQFNYIYKEKIKDKLKKPSQMTFDEIGLILDAYNYWLYEKKSKKTLQSIDREDKNTTERFSSI